MITSLKHTIAQYDIIIYVSQTIYKTMRKYIWLELICSYQYMMSHSELYVDSKYVYLYYISIIKDELTSISQLFPKVREMLRIILK